MLQISRLAASNVNFEPSYNLPSSGLTQDQKVHDEAKLTLSKIPRFKQALKNGNLTPLIVEEIGGFSRPSANPDKPGTTFQTPLETNTRTLFRDQFYITNQASIADRVSSPQFRNSAPHASGHKSMSAMSVADPRQQNVKPSTSPHVGPGYYHEDPLHAHTTGIPSFLELAIESHHMLPFSKDPGRASPAFSSLSREASKSQKLSPSAGMQFLPLDFDSWTRQKVGHFNTQPRNITAERWGSNVREPKALPVDQLYDTDNHRSCSAYLAAPYSPAYKTAFRSAIPRLVALPGGRKADPRILFRTHERLVATPASAGPGAYKGLEPPRFCSFNVALQSSEDYYSLASGTPEDTSYSEDARTLVSPSKSYRGASTGCGSLPQSPSKSSQSHQRPSASRAQTSGSQGTDGYINGLHSIGAETQGDMNGLVADYDWEIHAELLKQRYGSTGQNLPKGVPTAAALNHTDERDVVSGRHAVIAALTAKANDQTDMSSWEHPAAFYESQGQEVMQIEDFEYMQRKNIEQFHQLTFLRRKVPYKSLIKHHLTAASELKSARHKMNQAFFCALNTLLLK
ncbi:hypothetical protein CEUSTIGMA_g4955.t1 [Chlamydomonas eustigma]|uniref:Uncharacterized protein n=1 Tax=Chlamydomonas eustigma TaxID=1157962 RepID=A0A250X376_9CHLO|nr:hypothetical protein CEUSTIGMA_g4955.t1 [Chlamydomonas eustigma]|eukprot:GAX77511.1 hypothetical protein CEUSTIGMA_g4955.t1 [Chlamydomonas eustigma]